jgi:hypothetical protein
MVGNPEVIHMSDKSALSETGRCRVQVTKKEQDLPGRLVLMNAPVAIQFSRLLRSPAVEGGSAATTVPGPGADLQKPLVHQPGDHFVGRVGVDLQLLAQSLP